MEINVKVIIIDIGLGPVDPVVSSAVIMGPVKADVLILIGPESAGIPHIIKLRGALVAVAQASGIILLIYRPYSVIFCLIGIEFIIPCIVNLNVIIPEPLIGIA